VSRDFEAGNK